jgi:mRNA interferase MazF
VSRDDLIEQAGVLTSAKLSETEDALRLAGQEMPWTPLTAARLSEIRDALPLGGLKEAEKERTPPVAWPISST